MLPFHPFHRSLKIQSFLHLPVMATLKKPSSQNAPAILRNYPVPLSPPLPAISKDMELARAMTASSKSSLFALSRAHVLYEDHWLIAVNKPPGIYCDAVLASVPRLLDASPDFSPPPQGTEVVGSLELHLANRLDRDTSGVMLITKSHKVASKLVKAFTDHKVHKSYIALCVGQAPKWKRISIKSGHGRSKFGAWRVYAASDIGHILPGGSTVRDMETRLQLLSINGHGSFSELSELATDAETESFITAEEPALPCFGTEKDVVLVRAFPRSGRTHQIRLHCRYLGIPIIGDVKYEGVHQWNGRMYEAHELHAESLWFEHPVTGVDVRIEASLPLWAAEACQKITDQNMGDIETSRGSCLQPTNA